MKTEQNGMSETYTIEITKKVPYDETGYRYEAADGKRYNSVYGIPEGTEYKKVLYVTGEIKSNDTQLLRQTVEKLDLTAVIKAINAI